MKKCPNCGNVYQDNVDVCANCGAKTVQQFAPPPYQKKKKKPKIGLIIFLVIVGLISVKFWAEVIFEPREPDKEITTEAGTNAAIKTETTEQPKDYASFSYFDVKIANCYFTESYGDKYIVIEYDYTNKREDAKSWSVQVEDTVFQNGVELVSGIVPDIDYKAEYADVKQGVTLRVPVAYHISDTATDITVEINPFFRSEKYTFTIDLG